jgi:putative spermidine/putrescine transport system substrate-binding protein
MAAMQKASTVDATAAAALPPVNGTPVFLSADQATAAKNFLASHWAAAIA